MEQYPKNLLSGTCQTSYSFLGSSVKHLGSVIRVIWAALMNQASSCQKPSCFYKKKPQAPYSSCGKQFWLDIHYGRCTRGKMEIVSILFLKISHSCQGLRLLKASVVIHQLFARPRFDLFYAHPVSMIQHLETTNLHFCALCLALNVTEENPEFQRFRVKAVGGRVPEELA